MHALLLRAFLALAAEAAPELALKAGTARVDITPSTPMQMYGYANRKCGIANGTHDPLFAKVLVLELGASRMAIVTLDLGAIASDTLSREISAKLKIPVTLLAASHTHSAPSFLPFGSNPQSGAEASAYRRTLEQKVLAAVGEASRSMFPARLSVGRGSVQLGYNRLIVREDGRARALWDNLERVPYGPVDPDLVVLRVEDGTGKPRAIVVHYAAHPVVLGPTSCKYSADYPGVVQAKVEADLPGVQCMFVQGGAGDINPLFQGRTGKEEEDFAPMKKMGELLAAEVLRANAQVKPIGPLRHPIEHRSTVLTFADRWEKGKKVDVGITTVLINREIAIAALPGEPMHRFQKIWKQQAEVPVALFYGYTFSAGGTWPGYIPDLRSAAYGGYGADVSTRVELGAGERIMQKHLIDLYGLLGMWRDKPGRP